MSLLPADSGNSSEDSDSEDLTEKKPDWTERTDQAVAAKQEEEQVEEETGVLALSGGGRPAARQVTLRN